MLEITAGGKVSNANGYLGYSSGSAGAVTVTGSGSQWISGGELQVGRSGSGMLSIIAGGLVSSDSAGIGDVSSGSVNIEAGGKFSVREGASLGGPVGTTGTATITGIGSIWTIGDHLSFGVAGTSKLTVTDGGRVTAGTLWASLSDLAGNGTITVTQGAMLDADMNFDASRGLTQILSFGSGGTLNLTLVPGCELGAGYNGTGTMRIADGMTVDSIYGCLGYHSGSTGKATVTGTGSTWSVGNSGYWLWSLFVGGSGSGILKIEAGGQVSSTTAYLGKDSGATGMVTVTGVDTNWTNTGTIYVGYSGASTLMVADGGKVTASGMSINSQSAVRVNVSGNGMIVLGDTANAGSFGNDGACSLYANAFLAANTYTPISDYADRPMNLTGAYLAYGGTWNSGALTFTVPVATLVTAGPTNAVSSGQRLVFSDPGSGRHVGISFGTVSAGTTVSAVYLAPEELEALPMPPAYVLSAWDFTTNFTGDQAMLAFDIGLGVQNPAVWRYDGSAWAPYTADLFTYDSAGVVSFIVNDFDGYAVVGVPVPEPATLGLLALGGLAILRRQAKRDRRRG
jgi:T5SS/PEP-CTERM-associated repeat protein